MYQVLQNGTDRTPPISPLISSYAGLILGFVNGLVLSVLTGAVGMLTNAANICVYLKMGLTETTTISFFSLSVADLFVCMSTIVVNLAYTRPVIDMELPSGAKAGEIGIGACFILYPCLGCSAWITTILSVERCLCIVMPLKVRHGTVIFCSLNRGAVAQSVGRAILSEEVLGSIPAVTARSLLVGLVSVLCDRLRQKSWSPRSASCAGAYCPPPPTPPPSPCL